MRYNDQNFVPKNGSYKIHLIREIEAPHLEIWPLQTMSFQCSQDGLGRSRQLLLDVEGLEVIALYVGGQTETHYITEPLSSRQKDFLKRIVPWEKYQ